MEPLIAPGKHDANAIKLIAFYEIARRAKLTNHPDLINWPAFQKAKELFESRAKYLGEAFGNQHAIDAYFDLHLEGELASLGNSLQGVWAEFAPESLKKFPLPPGSI